MNNIIGFLKENNEASGYRVVSLKKETYELFFVHRKLETVRATDTTTTNVTVYVNHDGKTGDSSFAVYESMTDDDVKSHISSAVNRAKLVFNEPYELPDGGELEAEIESNMNEYEPRELAEKIADAVFAADCIENGSINATEIFLYRETFSIQNSRGINKTQVKYHALIEAIPTYTEGDESVELYEAYRFTEFNPGKITAEIAAKMKEVALRRKATKPQTPLSANIVLRDKEIASLMSELSYDLNYAAVYSQSNLHHKNDELQKGECDALNLSLVGQIRGSGSSSYFDDDGVTLRDTKLITNGIVTGYYGAHRFASYLKEPETGNLRCMKLEAGTLTENELEKLPYIECVSLSGLQVDLYNDYIGGEIRLAYRHENGKTEPITGITMSAKLSDVLNTLRLSENTTVSERYAGPDKLLMKNVTVM